MDTEKFFLPVATKGPDGQPERLLGTAWVATPDGGLVTCRHVVDQVDSDGNKIEPFVVDLDQNLLVPVYQSQFSADETVDLAFLPNVVDHGGSYLPILDPKHLLLGSDSRTYGYCSPSAGRFPVEARLFTGAIASVQNGDRGGIKCLLPFAVIEGMSGSPLFTYHNGNKVLGVLYGNDSQRVVAAEIIEVRDGERHYVETTNRMVEFGLAHHAQTLLTFLTEVGAAFVVSDAPLEIPGIGN